MKKILALFVGLICIVFTVMYFVPEEPDAIPATKAVARLLPHVSLSMVGFQENTGQWAEEIRYMGKWNGGSVLFLESEVVLIFEERAGQGVLTKNENQSLSVLHARNIPRHDEIQQTVIRMQFEGSRDCNPVGEGIKDIVVNSFIGKDQAKWRKAIPSYDTVQYTGLYDGIDMRFYFTKEGVLKYEYTVCPGADYTDIQVEYNDVDAIDQESDGRLRIDLCGHSYYDDAVVAYAMNNGQSFLCQARYQIMGRMISYDVAGRDMHDTLVIDPGFSTYVGSEGNEQVCVSSYDANSSEIYCYGSTSSLNWYVIDDAYQQHMQGVSDGIVIVFSLSDNRIVRCTYIGGSLHDGIVSMSVDENIVICGITSSGDYPTTEGSYQPIYGGGEYDGFVSCLSRTLDSLCYSTFIGGGYDYIYAGLWNAVPNEIVIAGLTASQSFPRTPGAAQTLYGGGDDDAFIAKLSGDGKQLIYSTLLGGNGYDEALGLAVDSLGQAYVCGYTTSTDFPIIEGAYQDSIGGQWGNCFVTKVRADGKRFMQSTYLGSWDGDRADDILLDGEDGLYITGRAGLDFPVTAEAYQRESHSPTSDGFISKLSLDLSTLIYSTYIGGSRTTELDKIVRDRSGNIYVSGGTYASDFPVPAHSKYPPETNHGCDMVVAVLDSTLSSLIYSAVIGGAEWDYETGMLLDSNRNMYISGSSRSTDFPTTPGAFQEQYGGGELDGVLVMIPAEDIVVSTPPVSSIPATCTLQPSYPNPVSGSGTLTIPYSVPERGKGEIVVYTSTGAKVASYPLSHGTAGTYSISLALPSLSQGVYFSTLTYNGKQQTKRFVVQE